MAFEITCHYMSLLFIPFRNHPYRVDHQCCPGGNCPETPRRPSAGGLRIFWLKSLDLPVIYPKNPETPRGGPPDDFRRDNIDGPHGMYIDI